MAPVQRKLEGAGKPYGSREVIKAVYIYQRRRIRLLDCIYDFFFCFIGPLISSLFSKEYGIIMI